MANNVLGTKITDLEEAQAAGLTDDALLIVESETPPTKRSKLSTFFTWVKGKLAAWILSSYDEVMAATEAGYLVDALAVKDGFTQLNTNNDATTVKIVDGIFIQRKYDVVTLLFVGGIPSIPIGTNDGYVKIAEKYRPQTPVYFLCKPGGADERTVLLQVNSNGNVVVYNYTDGPLTYLFGSCSYVV